MLSCCRNVNECGRQESSLKRTSLGELIPASREGMNTSGNDPVDGEDSTSTGSSTVVGFVVGENCSTSAVDPMESAAIQYDTERCADSPDGLEMIAFAGMNFLFFCDNMSTNESGRETSQRTIFGGVTLAPSSSDAESEALTNPSSQKSRAIQSRMPASRYQNEQSTNRDVKTNCTWRYTAAYA